MKINPAKDIVLNTERLTLKTLDPSYANIITNYYIANRKYFEKSMPTLSDEFFTEKYQFDRSWREFDQMAEQRFVRLYVFGKDDVLYEKIAGDISIGNILFGNAMSCVLGYKIGRDFHGNGFATEALKEVIDYIFSELGLHRIEANVLESNKPSLRVLDKLGFASEAIARKYAKIEGRWQDHLRYSLINPEH